MVAVTNYTSVLNKGHTERLNGFSFVFLVLSVKIGQVFFLCVNIF